MSTVHSDLSTKQKLHDEFLVGAAIGSGSSALAAERGDVDFLLAINAGRLRNMGAPSIACMLPITDADALTEDFARREVLSQCRKPVLLGISVWSDGYAPTKRAAYLASNGYAGATNFPSCMHFSKPMQQILGRAGRGIESEVEQLRIIQETGLLTMFYCATRTQARLAADAGLELICLNLGWNAGGVTGHRRRMSLQEVATMAREVRRLVQSINPSTRLLVEGGPIVNASDLATVLKLADIDGYIGGSTIERVPVEATVAYQIERFRQASRRKVSLEREDDRLVSWSRRFGFIGQSSAQLFFLRRLKHLVSASQPILILSESGADLRPTFNALASGEQRSRSSNIVEFDATQDGSANRVDVFLFGHRDTISQRTPALADSAIDLLIIHGAHLLSASFQRRLSNALITGGYRVPASRTHVSVHPRIVLVCQTITRTLFDQPTTDVDSLVAAGFEQGLAQSLSGWTLNVPSVQMRIDDLFALIQAYAKNRLGRSIDATYFTRSALKLLRAHRWPLNEAEIVSLLGALAGQGETDAIEVAQIRELLTTESKTRELGHTERDRILDALWRNSFNRTRTAEALGLSRKTLYNKIKKFGLWG